jgi:hypothetical protein
MFTLPFFLLTPTQTPGMALKCCGMYLNHLKSNPNDTVLAVAGAKGSPTIVVRSSHTLKRKGCAAKGRNICIRGYLIIQGVTMKGWGMVDRF